MERLRNSIVALTLRWNHSTRFRVRNRMDRLSASGQREELNATNGVFGFWSIGLIGRLAIRCFSCVY